MECVGGHQEQNIKNIKLRGSENHTRSAGGTGQEAQGGMVSK